MSRRRWTTSRGAPAWASGTLYRHFPTKDVLVGELMRLKLAEFAERVRRKFEEESEPWAAFEGGLREQVDVMARGRRPAEHDLRRDAGCHAPSPLRRSRSSGTPGVW